MTAESQVCYSQNQRDGFDICDPSPNVMFVLVTSNEPDNGLGDGNTVDGIVIIDGFTFKLRAEVAKVQAGYTL